MVGQSAVYSQGLANYAGEPGWNVQVSTYYNVEMIDPIFRVIMGPVPIHLTGRVELQNEGIDATVKEYIGGIPPYFIDNCVEAGTCGSGSVPYISVQDDFSDFSEPAGGRFTVSVNDHTAATDYILHFTNGGFNQTIPFRTDSLGGKLITVLISVSAPATSGGPDYKIYTSEASDAGQTPVATCLGDGATNAPCFSVTSGSPTIIARNVDDDDRDQKQQPLNINPARWPISSSIPIYLFGHNPNSSYRIMFDDQLSSAAPGTLWFQGTSVTQIPTDASFGTNEDNEPGYYIATGYSPGVGLTIASNDGSSDIATTEVDLIEAGIDIQGETSSITTTHPQDDVVGVVIRNLAPQQQYQVFVDDGISPNQIFRANDNGEVSLSYRVPYNSHNPGDPPKKVEIYALDYGRGTNDNKIASRWIWLWTDADPYINVPGGARWPAGTPITIQLRRHLANTEYEVYVQKGSAASPSFSELINGSSITTFENPQTGLGEYDISYTLPFTLDGFYTIRSFLPSDLTNPVAEYEIEVTANPHISVDGGIRWAAGTEVTIRLRGHAANTPYQVWLDRDGPQETFIGTVLVDGAGEGTIQYTIPQDMPSQVEPGYPIYSYLNDSITADDGELEVAELDLVVTRIDVPVVTFDIEIPVEVTIQNQGDVTTTATLFDTDIYVDPETPPSLSSALPPGDYKTWVGSVPPGGEVTIDESIVLFGQETHELYARTDTSDQIIETNELNNMLLKVVDAACPVTLVDEFNDSVVGAEWTQTDFGDSGPGCTPPADLPPVSTGGGTVVLERTWDNSGNPEGFQPVFDFLNEGLPTPSNYQVTSSGSYGNPYSSLYVGPQGDTGGSTSVGGYIDFNLSSASDVTINFDYGPAIRELDTNDWAEYYFLLDGTALYADRPGYLSGPDSADQ